MTILSFVCVGRVEDTNCKVGMSGGKGCGGTQDRLGGSCTKTQGYGHLAPQLGGCGI